ncbi:unnamed protein product [Paramecium pentaurelia]|uniref:Uncharacterized protein n=1 Tax=Paramecium pentaurelia TaxID=43138 RepID=A0A8S1XBI7_9CILI|nr:unnamed protein product [Paramecium pentaurelia]
MRRKITYYVWDCCYSRFVKSEVQMIQTSKQEFQYTTIQGSILKFDIIYRRLIDRLLHRMEKFQKMFGRCYFEKNDEVKQGLWKELIKSYWSKVQVYQIEEYCNVQRT